MHTPSSFHISLYCYAKIIPLSSRYAALNLYILARTVNKQLKGTQITNNGIAIV